MDGDMLRDNGFYVGFLPDFVPRGDRIFMDETPVNIRYLV